jgi:hypothetical protein
VGKELSPPPLKSAGRQKSLPEKKASSSLQKSVGSWKEPSVGFIHQEDGIAIVNEPMPAQKRRYAFERFGSMFENFPSKARKIRPLNSQNSDAKQPPNIGILIKSKAFLHVAIISSTPVWAGGCGVGGLDPRPMPLRRQFGGWNGKTLAHGGRVAGQARAKTAEGEFFAGKRRLKVLS